MKSLYMGLLGEVYKSTIGKGLEVAWIPVEATVKGLTNIVGQTKNGIVNVLGSGKDGVLAVISDAYKGTRNQVGKFVNRGGSMTGKGVDGALTGTKNLYKWGYDRTAGGIGTIKDLSKYSWDKGANALSTATQIAKNTGSKGASLAKYGLQKGGSAISSTGSKLGSKANSPVLSNSSSLRPSTVVSEAVHDVGNIVDNTQANIRNLFTTLYEGKKAA